MPPKFSSLLSSRASSLVAALVTALLPIVGWTTDLVGVIPGQFAVSSTGAATYTMPIETPAATAGMRPDVALTYNHRGGTGVAGMGWTVGGLSQITRCAQTLDQDGAIRGVRYDSDDRFCLDGLRLKVTSGTYGAANSEYRTEIEGFRRIVAYGQEGNGPQYFIVTDRNGLKHYFGHYNESSIEYTYNGTYKNWSRYKTQDTFGNRIEYFYDTNTATGEHLLEKIEYIGNTTEALSPHYRMRFTYGTRPGSDQRSGYIFGAIWSKTKRLTDIDVEWLNTTIWESISNYSLTYSTGVTGRSQLDEVERCRGASCLPETLFTWQDAVKGWASDVSTTRSSSTHTNPLVGDFNGDGREDLFVVDNGEWHVLPAASGSLGAAIDTNKTATNPTTARVVDFNGDNLADLAFSGTDSEWHIYLSTGTGFTEIDTGESSAIVTRFYFQDMDGDGRDDVIYRDNLNVKLRLSTGTDLAATASTILTLPAAVMQFSIYGKVNEGLDNQVDFDGDGRGDIILKEIEQGQGGGPKGGGGGPVTYWIAYRFDGTSLVTFDTISTSVAPDITEINGDGLDDITYYDASAGAYKSEISAGKSFANAVTSSISNSYSAEFVDYDKDGREDLIRPTASNWVVHVSEGDSYDTTGINIGGPDPLNSPVYVMDVTGNGSDDLVMSYSSYWRLKEHQSDGVDLVTKMTDGFGNFFEPTYASIHAIDDYTFSDTPSFPNQRSTDAIYVVDEFDTNDGIGGSYTMDLEYWNALRHTQGRGFLGFGKRRLTDTRNGIYSDDEFQQAFPYIGRLETRTVDQGVSINKDIEVTEHTWASTTLGSGNSERKFVKLELSATTIYEVGGTDDGLELREIETDPTYETTYGNVTQNIVTTNSPQFSGDFVTTTDYEYYNYTTPWCVSLEKKRTVTRSAPSSTTDSRVVERTFDTSDCSVSTVADKSDTDTTTQLEVSLGYDDYGNVTEVVLDSVQGAVADRKTVIGYDSYGQYPEDIEQFIDSLTNPEISYTWDYKVGKRLSTTDVQGQQTTWTYDVFGRMTNETRPDGTNTDISYVDCIDCWITDHGRFYVLSEDSSGFDARDYRDRFGRSIGGWRYLPGGEKANTEIEHDDEGRILKIKGPWVDGETGYTKEYDYDLIGRLVEEDRPESESITSGALTSIARTRLTHAVTNSEAQVTTYKLDAIGRVIEVIDDDMGDTDYEYTVFDQINRVTDPDDAVTTIVYDDRGYKESMTVPDMGTWEYTYSVFGQLLWQEDAKGQEIDFTYNQLGLLTDRDDEIEGLTEWDYYTTSDHKLWLLESVSSPGGFSEDYSYDTLSRISSVSTTIDTTTYDTDFSYHSTGSQKGMLQRITYPTSTAGVRAKADYAYDAWGFLHTVKDGNSPTTVFYELHETDALGRERHAELGNGLDEVRDYDDASRVLLTIDTGPNETSAIQELSYTWDTLANLTKREDLRQSVYEDFTYDDVNRLDTVVLNGSSTTLDVDYSAGGNIDEKSDVGVYTYGIGQEHAVTSIDVPAPGTDMSFDYDANGNMTDRDGDTITWYAFNKPKKIDYGTDYAEFEYGAYLQRTKQEAKTGSTTITTYYVSPHFEVEDDGSNTVYRHNIVANGQTVAIRSRPVTGTVTTNYVHRDHLNSVVALTDLSGTVVQRFSYDAFGKRRNTDWTTGNQFGTSHDTERGYTGHEHLDNVRLIHMNGRVQDPVIGRMTSADPFVPNRFDGQSFNHFSYVLNNPLSRIDPTGFDPRDPDGPLCRTGPDCVTPEIDPTCTTGVNCEPPEPEVPWHAKKEAGGGSIAIELPRPIEVPWPVGAVLSEGAIIVVGQVGIVLGGILYPSSLDPAFCDPSCEPELATSGTDDSGVPDNPDEVDAAGDIGTPADPNGSGDEGDDEDKSLGNNPFKNKSPEEIDKMLRARGYEPRGPDPLNGRGGYINPRTGRSYHIDPGGTWRSGTEGPHVDVNRLPGSKLPKRKYPSTD